MRRKEVKKHLDGVACVLRNFMFNKVPKNLRHRALDISIIISEHRKSAKVALKMIEELATDYPAKQRKKIIMSVKRIIDKENPLKGI